MRTVEYLFGPDAQVYRALFLPSFVVALAISMLGATLSALVVLKRMSFIGQGVSHAAFGGVGLAALLGVSYTAANGGGSWLFLGLVAAFCIASGVGMALLSDREQEDAAIAVVLVASMAMGALLLHAARTRSAGAAAPSFEDVLFGSVLAVTWGDAIAACAVAMLVGAAMWWYRRPVLMWAFDEGAAPAFGVSATGVRIFVMTTLAVAIVVSMKLAGVVLASALLVFPGASALRLSTRLKPVFVWSGVLSVLGVLGGMVGSFELDTPPGPTMVVSLVVIYVACVLVAVVRTRTGMSGGKR